MLKDIINLGEEIQAKLANNNLSFQEIALSEIQKIKICLSLNEFDQEVSNWLHNDKLPKQLNVFNNFGQPPVTVFNNGHFVIDLYFWMQSDTSIHGHAFSGAFKVLYGKSLHEVYKVTPLEKYAHDIMKTDIKRESANILYPGDSHKILPGDKFYHRVIHLETPTVTLCARTVNDLTVPQWHHFENGLSVLKKEFSEQLYKKLFYANYQISRNHKNRRKILDKFLASLELSETLNLLEQITVDSMGLSEETTEFLYNEILRLHSRTKWFSKYEDFCQNQNQQEIYHGKDPLKKFLNHAQNTGYPKKLKSAIEQELKVKK